MQSTANSIPPDDKGEGKMIFGVCFFLVAIFIMCVMSGCSWFRPKDRISSATTVNVDTTSVDSTLFSLKAGEYKWLSRDLQAVKTPDGKLQIIAYHQKETVTTAIPAKVKIKNSNNADSFNKDKSNVKDKSKVKTVTKTITKTQLPAWMLYWLIGLTVFAVWKSGILQTIFSFLVKVRPF